MDACSWAQGKPAACVYLYALHLLWRPQVPRFRAVHEEVIKLDQDFGSTFSGCLTDTRGRVRALWGSYAEQVMQAGSVMTHES